MLRPFPIFQNVPRVTANFVRYNTVYKDGSSKPKLGIRRWHRDTRNLFGKVQNIRKTNEKCDQKTAAHGTTINTGHDNITSERDLNGFSQVIIPKDQLYNVKGIISPSEADELNLRNVSATPSQSPQQISRMKPLVNSSVLAARANPFLSIITRNLRSFPILCNQKVDAKSEGTNSSKLIHVTSEMQGDARSYPSVTTILNETMSEQAKSALEKWKGEKISELGQKGFEAFQKAQLGNGIKFHKAIQRYLSESKEPLLEKEIEGVWASSTEVLKMVSKVMSIESYVAHPILKYRGIIDCIASFGDKPTLIEWKKSDKPKHALTATFDNPVQLAAYFGAVSHDPNYKQLKIRDVLLVIAYTDGSKADYFHLNAEEMRKHWSAWLTRYENYLEMKGSDQTTLTQGGKRMFQEDGQHLE